ncbi:MAG: hypothetical protein JW959_05150 [Pirellulales bacterium]|nr:hypothetical protein [Pirellulales bacterium]
MQRSLLLLFVASLVLWPVGCMDDYVPAPSPPAARQEEQPSPEPTAVSENPGPEPAAEASESVAEPKEQPVKTPPLAGPRIALDLGVALPQTGPEGTMMMFSVQYEFVSGAPDPKAQYFWVIERAKGAPQKIPCHLQRKHKLETPISGWRPNEGPFHSHIEDADGKRLSDSIEMK